MKCQRGEISGQKVWAAKKRPKALKKQEEDLWSQSPQAACKCEALCPLSGGMGCLRGRQRQARGSLWQKGTQGQSHSVSRQGAEVWRKGASRKGNCRGNNRSSPVASIPAFRAQRSTCCWGGLGWGGASVFSLGKSGILEQAASRQNPTSRNVLFGPHNIFKNICIHCQHLKIGRASSNSSFLKFICKSGGCGMMSLSSDVAK